jgi:mono/diheme cytochrome c family protein
MNRKTLLIIAVLLIAVIGLGQCKKDNNEDNRNLVAEGREIFRFDTFGDEEWWSGTLHLDKAIAGEANGGFGGGVSPKTALAVGLKVDAEALPPAVVQGISSGTISLDDPATTLELLKLNAVVGVKGTFNPAGGMASIGITCAACHSTVDDSFAPGIGKRLDGWPNRDLNVGAIISLTDNAKPLTDLLHVNEETLRQVLSLWGPGKFNAALILDGKAMRPDGKVAANLLPAAFGLKNIELTTYTGFGDISYWNAFVGTLEMHGKGSFHDPRLNDPVKYPIAVENSFWNISHNPDLLTSKLPALKAYQHSISAPRPPEGTYDRGAAGKGKALFLTKAKCAQCHTPPLLADNKLHSASEIGIDDFEALRSPTGKYRTTPLGGLFARSKGGFYHDGRFSELGDVVNHYDNFLKTSLSAKEKEDLVEYLKSL